MVRLALYHDPGDHRSRLPGLTGHLGMVPRAADHRCPYVQELQFRGGEFNDVHDGLYAIQHLGADSGIPAMGYTSKLAGLVLSGGGVVLLVMMPVVGRLTSKIQARWLIATGWLCLAIGLFYCAHEIDLFVSFRFAMWLRVAQVIGIGFLFVPITAAGYNGVPPDKGNSISGMIRLHA